LVIGFIKKKVIEDEEVRVIGYVRADNIYSTRTYVIGFLEVFGEIRSSELFVKGCIKARKIIANKIFLFSSSHSTLLDVKGGFVLLRGENGGKISVSVLRAKYAVLEWTYIHNICADRVKVYSGVVFDRIKHIGELIIRDPYISIRLENINNIGIFNFQYNIYKHTS